MDFDKEVDARADMLEARADALCPKLSALDRLQRQLDYRLPDGSALRLIDQEQHGRGTSPEQDKLADR